MTPRGWAPLARVDQLIGALEDEVKVGLDDETLARVDGILDAIERAPEQSQERASEIVWVVGERAGETAAQVARQVEAVIETARRNTEQLALTVGMELDATWFSSGRGPTPASTSSSGGGHRNPPHHHLGRHPRARDAEPAGLTRHPRADRVDEFERQAGLRPRPRDPHRIRLRAGQPPRRASRRGGRKRSAGPGVAALPKGRVPDRAQPAKESLHRRGQPAVPAGEGTPASRVVPGNEGRQRLLDAELQDHRGAKRVRLGLSKGRVHRDQYRRQCQLRHAAHFLVPH